MKKLLIIFGIIAAMLFMIPGYSFSQTKHLIISPSSVKPNSYDFAMGTMQTLASVNSATKPSSPNRKLLTDNSIDHPVIDVLYSYDLVLRFFVGGESAKFHGAVIVYQE